MALRRVLPSRATPPAGQERPAAPPSPPAAPTAENPPAPTLPETPAVAETQQLAAAATTAFSTLPSGTPRVLEDSFQQPATPAPSEEPVPAAEAVPPTEQPPEAAPAPVPETPEPKPEPAPEPEPAPPAPAGETPAQPAASPEAPLNVPGFGVAEEASPFPAVELPAAPATSPESTPEPEPAPQAPTAEPEPSPVQLEEPPAHVAEAAPPVEEAAAQPAPGPAPVTTPEPAPEAEPAPQAAKPEPAKPGANRMRRRVRDKRPRDFSAAKGAEAAPEQSKAETKFAERVPVSSQPLNKVDEELIASGILAPPPADTLTSSVPTGLAESEGMAEPQSTPAVQPQPQPQPPQPEDEEPLVLTNPVEEPAAPPEAQPETAAEPVPAPFNLGKQPEAAAEPLPPVKSDLPWTTPQPAADWDISIPETPSWSHEGAPAEMPPAEPAQLPPPTDLYRPQAAESPIANPPWASGAAAPASPRAASTLPPPELPSTTHRRNGGVPWGVVAVGLLLAGGAAYLALRPSGSGRFQDQMARLTGALQDQPETLPGVSGTAVGGLVQPNGLLPAPSSTLFSGAPLPPLATPAENAATSGSTVIDFADVPPELANQPIVADGSEKMPEDLSMMAKFQREVMRARARKEDKAEGQIGGPAESETAEAETAPKEEATPYTEEKLQAELAAYRRALAASPNPGNLKPAQFMKDPAGYMDGKPLQNAATGNGTAAANEAALLPPPELYTNNPKNLPVVAEPVANAPARVRTLADFNLPAFTPEHDHVEIPKGLKPHLAATDFPALEVLSYVPNRGIVAYADGREGVLLIGESLNGWELVGVSSDRAEFKAGHKTYRVSAD